MIIPILKILTGVQAALSLSQSDLLSFNRSEEISEPARGSLISFQLQIKRKIMPGRNRGYNPTCKCCHCTFIYYISIYYFIVIYGFYGDLIVGGGGGGRGADRKRTDVRKTTRKMRSWFAARVFESSHRSM